METIISKENKLGMRTMVFYNMSRPKARYGCDVRVVMIGGWLWKQNDDDDDYLLLLL
jgi:hypothetical protein